MSLIAFRGSVCSRRSLSYYETAFLTNQLTGLTTATRPPAARPLATPAVRRANKRRWAEQQITQCQELKEAGTDDSATRTTLIKRLALLGDSKRAFDEWEASGNDPSSAAAVMQACAKSGDTTLAHKVMAALNAPSSTMQGLYTQTLAKSGEIDAALKVCQDIIAADGTLRESTLAAVAEAMHSATQSAIDDLK